MAVNLWPNADLEEATAPDWQPESDAVKTWSDFLSWEQTYSTKGVINGAYDGLKTTVKSIVSASTQYTVSFYLYPTNASMNMQVQVYDQDSNVLANGGFNTYTADTWTRVVTTFTTDVGDTGIKFRIVQDAGTETGDIYIDGIMLETGGSASAWVNYVAGVEFTVGNVGNISIASPDPTILVATTFTVGNVGNSSIAGYNPNTTIGTGLWEVGAYIYDVIGEIHVNVGNVGAVGVDGFNPATLSADTTFTVGNVGGVSIASPDPTVTFTQDTIMGNVGAVVIAGFAAVVTGIAAAVGGGITRIAMKMATILRR